MIPYEHPTIPNKVTTIEEANKAINELYVFIYRLIDMLNEHETQNELRRE